MNQTRIPVIAIDGPTASGKGTVASRVASALGMHYLDSGALYRLCALSCIEQGIDLHDEKACAQAAATVDPLFENDRIFLNGQDVTEAIRQEKVGVAASLVAAMPTVRSALFELQRRARRAPGLVADGRDMGSVVFADADLKVFLTASAQARANRRFKQLIEKGISANLADLTCDLLERDRRDRERSAAPCLATPDARVLDSSEMTVEQTVEQVLSWWKLANTH